MTSLMQQIAEIVNNPAMPGWSSVEKCQRMAALVVAINAETSVELGVYGGKSFIALALAHKWLAHGSAVAIDPWENKAAMEGYTGENKTFWQNQPLEKIYQDFLALLDRTETRHRCHVWRQKSDDVQVPSRIDILHVDGQHTIQAIKDVSRFAPNVIPGGFCVLDDLGWSNGVDAPVADAAETLRAIGYREIYQGGTDNIWAIFQRR